MTSPSAWFSNRAPQWRVAVAIVVLAAVPFALSFAGAVAPSTASAEPRPTSTAADVAGVFAEHCTHCHGAGRTSAGLDLTGSPADLVGRVASQGAAPLVVAGSPGESYVMLKVTGKASKGARMPLGASLPPEKIDVIRTWIADGAR